MGETTGFLKWKRETPTRRPVPVRLRDWNEVYEPFAREALVTQAGRCMDCGIPFCNNGCPLGNLIPDWNDLVYRDHWRDAIERLHATNNFPEFTGRLCPAPCEAACVLGINADPVTIKQIEVSIIEKAFDEGFVVPIYPKEKTGKRVAVVGSGPAGMACAQQLARAGHDVTLFERDDRVGGLLRYGIPDFKMEKHLIDFRMRQMEAEGVTFKAGVDVGVDVSMADLKRDFEAIVIASGATKPRDLPVPGRELDGIHFAMDFLPQQNKVVAGDWVAGQIMATGKHVVIIGGGDTGSDCVGTSNRHGAASITQFELLPQPPEQENKPLVWPYWPIKMRTSSSHEEGCERDWSVATKRFEGVNGKVKTLVAAHVEWKDGKMVEVPGTEFELKADLVLLAMGFLGPVQNGLIDELGLDKDARSNVKATTDGAGCYQTSNSKVFTAGDMRRGQSLIVWAIREGRQCARAVDEFLMGSSELPR